MCGFYLCPFGDTLVLFNLMTNLPVTSVRIGFHSLYIVFMINFKFVIISPLSTMRKQGRTPFILLEQTVYAQVLAFSTMVTT